MAEVGRSFAFPILKAGLSRRLRTIAMSQFTPSYEIGPKDRFQSAPAIGPAVVIRQQSV